jgi:hypothetical protein
LPDEQRHLLGSVSTAEQAETTREEAHYKDRTEGNAAPEKGASAGGG